MRHSTPNPPKMFKHLQCEAHRTRSAVEVQHGSSQAISPAALYPPEASRKSDKNVPSLRSPLDLEVQHGPSPQAFNAKPTGPDQPLRFSMALPLRPSVRCTRLQREAHRTRSAVEVQHGSSPQAISSAALHPSEASRKSDKNVQSSSLRSPQDHLRR